MPDSAIYLVSKIIYAILSALSGKGGNHGYDLLILYTLFLFILIVTDAGVGIPYTDDAVEYILSVTTAVEDDVILFQLVGFRTQKDLVKSVTEHRVHAYSHRSKGNVAAVFYPFLYQRDHLVNRRKLFIIQTIPPKSK